MREKEGLFRELSRKHKLKFFILYTYNLTKKSKSHKVRFVYVLKGRPGEKGIVKQYQGKFLAPGCFIIPAKHGKDMQHIFELWKVPYKKRLILTY